MSDLTASATPVASDPAEITLFTTTWCPFCSRLTRLLTEQGVEYTEVDVEADAEATAFVESVNGGDRIVPTVRFSDGTTATNPGASEVRRRIAELVGA